MGRKAGIENRVVHGPCPDCGTLRPAQNPHKRCDDCAKRARQAKGRRDYARKKMRSAGKEKKTTRDFTMDDSGRLRNQNKEKLYILVYDALDDGEMREGMELSDFEVKCMIQYESFAPGTILRHRKNGKEIVL